MKVNCLVQIWGLFFKTNETFSAPENIFQGFQVRPGFVTVNLIEWYIFEQNGLILLLIFLFVLKMY